MKSILALALTVLPAALAVPSELVEREPGNVYLCAGTSFAEPCTNLFVGIGSSWTGNCQKLEEPYISNVGSMVPDKGALCRLFDAEHATCTGSGLAIVYYPGDENLFNSLDAGHRAQYISCVTCTNCQ